MTPLPRATSTLRWALGLALAIAGCTGCTAPDELEAELAAEELAPSDAAEAELAAPAEDEDSAAEPAAPEHPETELPLTLLATMAAAEVERSSATIRDERSGTIQTLRVGDAVGDDATIAAIERGRVLLERGGVVERLDVPRAAVRIDDSVLSFTEAPDADDPGVLRGGVQLSHGGNYVVKNADHAWGEAASVMAIQRAVTLYARNAPGGPKVHVGDLSRRGGGHFPPHLSHRSGRDVDVGYVLTGDDADVVRFRDAGKHNLDVARTWTLLQSFVATGYVRIIFVDTSIQRLLYNHAREAGADEATLEKLL
ncbi:MAG: penicillin-insensitive murein endopeptidase, partial [Myxococcales bacterium]|nr:penicillin-insensitive murein endopeptidase [Myxococcales bacterium]